METNVHTTSNMSDADVIHKFKLRRRQCFAFFWALIAIFIVREIYERSLPVRPPGPSLLDFIFFASGFCWVIFVMLRYRCPKCNNVPISEEPGYATVLLFPKRCGTCKAPFRDPNQDAA